MASVTVTHIGTATAIINIDGVNILTDPAFPDGSDIQHKYAVLKTPQKAAIRLPDLPHIDAILLSHEDHPDNLDPQGRTLLMGRNVITTVNGKEKLGGGPGITGLSPWKTVDLKIGGKDFTVTGTPARHVTSAECMGFILHTESLGTSNGLPNVIYFAGDTVYIEELKQITDKFNVVLALFNLGKATVPFQGEITQVTMDGKQAAQLIRDINPGQVVPMHFESWSHFKQKKDELAQVLEEEGVSDKVRFLIPGEPQKLV